MNVSNFKTGSQPQVREGGIRTKIDPATTEPVTAPTVSVIIASYNSQAVIETALKSIFDQSFTNREIIVVDGRSTDGTVDILEQHSDSIEYWISEPDSGVYEALNKGVGLARGDWLYFLGSDDYLYDSNVFERIFTNQQDGKLIYGNVMLAGKGPVGTNGKIYDGAFSKLKLCYQNICQQAMFYRKSLFESLGLFSLDYPVLADREFNMKVFANYGEEITHIDMIVAVFNTEGLSSLALGDNMEKDLPRIAFREFGLKFYLHLKACRTYSALFGGLGRR